MRTILLALAMTFAVTAQSQEFKELKSSKSPLSIEAAALIDKHVLENYTDPDEIARQRDLQALSIRTIFGWFSMLRKLPEQHDLLIAKLEKYRRSAHPLDVDWYKAVMEFIDNDKLK